MARAEVARAVSTFDFARGGDAHRRRGHAARRDRRVSRLFRDWTRVPAGPVLAIAPFNFPLNLVAHKVSPALACGCSVVLKPAPQAPLTSLLLAECIRVAGAPEEAVSVLPCDVPTAEKLVRDERFATLSFTGSAAVGWHLAPSPGRSELCSSSEAMPQRSFTTMRRSRRLSTASWRERSATPGKCASRCSDSMSIALWPRGLVERSSRRPRPSSPRRRWMRRRFAVR